MLTAHTSRKTKGRPRSWHRQVTQDQRFGHATGRLRVLEGLLLHHDELTLFSDRTTDLAVLGDILDRAAYPQAETLDERYAREEERIDALIKEVAAQSVLPQVLLLEKDYHNVKWMLKSLLLQARHEVKAQGAKIGQEAASTQGGFGEEEIASHPARYEIMAALNQAQAYTGKDRSLDTKQFQTEDILDALGVQQNEGPYPDQVASRLLKGYHPADRLWDELITVLRGGYIASPCDPMLIEGVLRALRAYLAFQDLSLIDIVLDRAYYEELAKWADASQCGSEREIILDFLALKADATNLQSLIRVVRAGLGPVYLSQVLVPGGDVSPERIVAEAYEPVSRLQEALAQQGEGSKSDLSIVESLYQHSLAASLVPYVARSKAVDEIRDFGRDRDNLLMRLADKGRLTGCTAEVVFGYWMAKQMELRNIRIMTASRSVDISFDATMRLLRDSYTSVA